MTKGCVIDSKSNLSDQIDIIIYDALYSPLIFTTESGEKFVPAESVYAIIEVKPELNKKYLEYADNKIASVKRLYRTSRSMISCGTLMKPRDTTKILGLILANTNSFEKNITLEEHLKNYKNINLGCSINSCAFYCERDDSLNLLGTQFSNDEECLIGFFFYLYNELHSIGTVAAIDIREYANTLSSIDFKKEEEF